VTGDPGEFRSFDEFMDAFGTQVNHFVDVKIRGSNVIERLYAEHLPVPFLSLLIDDCIAKGMDYNAGGARYNTSYIQGVGIGTVTDSLSAIRHHVFGGEAMRMADMLRMLAADFQDFERPGCFSLTRPPATVMTTMRRTASCAPCSRSTSGPSMAAPTRGGERTGSISSPRHVISISGR